jgi:cycloeucalenol cycloisomerase
MIKTTWREIVESASSKGYWFSKNPDRAWAEKFYLLYIPYFLVFNTAVQKLGLLDTGNFWNVAQNLAMWLPCVVLPFFLRRRSGVLWRKDYWFKFQLWMTIFTIIACYFMHEYFRRVLGIRYNFADVTWYLDSWISGPDGAARAAFSKVPLGIYINSIAFLTIYHNIAIICMRRVKTATLSLSPAVQRAAWIAIVVVSALFFAWAETYLYLQADVAKYVWYVNLPRMLSIGTLAYALYFFVSFPNLYRLDETPGESWSLSRVVIEVGFTCMAVFVLLDIFAWIYGPIY